MLLNSYSYTCNTKLNELEIFDKYLNIKLYLLHPECKFKNAKSLPIYKNLDCLKMI